MATSSSPRMCGLQKVITDISECVGVLKKTYVNSSIPITDDDVSLHRFCAKLEQALESGRKSRGLFGGQKCFWNYFCQCLISGKNTHDGVKFAKINDDLKTSFGRGRAFIRYCLMHRCLADSLQQCFINDKVTNEWYNQNSIPNRPDLWSNLMSSLYELNEVQFDLSPQVHDLDDGWPTFARKIFPSAYSWRPPSRSMSISSLNSSTAHSIDPMSSSIIEHEYEDHNNLLDRVSLLNEEVESYKSNEAKLIADLNDLKQYSQENKLLHEKITNLEISNNKLVAENERRSDDWREKEEQLVQKLVEAEKQASEYIARHECTKNQLETAIGERQDISNTINELQASNHNREIKIKLLEKELKYIRDAEFEQQIAELSNKVSELTTSNEIAEKKLTELSNENESLRRDCDSKDSINREMAEQLEKSGEKCSESNTVISELQATIKAIETDKEELIIKVASLGNDLRILQEEIQQKEDEIDVKLECQNCEVQKSNVLSLSEEIDGLKMQKTKLDVEKCELSQKHELLNREYDELMVDIAEKDKLLLRRETEIGEMKKSIKSVDVILCKQEVMIDDLEIKLKVSLEDNVKLNNEMKCLQETPRVPNIPEVSVSNSAEDEEAVVESDGAAVCENETDDVKIDEATVADASPVLTTASRTLTRLQSLVQEGDEIHNIVENAKEVRSTMINKVQEQEEKLKRQKEILEQSESRFEHLKDEHVKLLTSESILRYELKEKRKMLEKLKKQLNSSRNTWAAAQRVNDAAATEWQSLHNDFVSRPKQVSEESGFVDVNVESAIASQTSPVPEFSGNEFKVSDDKISASPGASPPSLEDRAERSKNRLQLLENQCEFLYMKLVQSSKKSEYLESKLNKLLGLNSDGSSDTEDNVESIPEIDDMARENLPQISSENCQLQLLTNDNAAGPSGSDVTDGAVPLQQSSTPLENGTDGVCTFSAYMNDMQRSAEDEQDDIMEEDEEFVTATEVKSDGAHNDDDDIPFADDEQSPEKELAPPVTMADEMQLQLDDMVNDEVKTNDSDSDVSGKSPEVKGVLEIRSGLQEMVNKAKAASSLNVQVQTLLTENEDLKNSIEKLKKEHISLQDKEAQMRKRADYVLKQEREKYDEKLNNIRKEQTELQTTLKDLENEKLQLETTVAQQEDTISILNKTKIEVEEQLNGVQFKLCNEAIKNEQTIKGYTEHEADINTMQQQISEQEHLIIYLEESLKDIKDGRQLERAKQFQELEQLQFDLSTRNEECGTLADQLKDALRHLDEEKNLNEKLKSVLEETKLQNFIFVTKLESQLSQLRKDNRDLMEKLIKLIRDKDLLWQKTDRLTDMQKNSMLGQWMDDSETHKCLNCNIEFSLFIRKHHCRLCGRIFCKDCSNNWLKIAASSAKSRVCNNCYVSRDAFVTDDVDKSVLGNSNEEGADNTNTIYDPEFDVSPRQRSLSASAAHNLSSSIVADSSEIIDTSASTTLEISPETVKPNQLFRSSSAPSTYGMKKLKPQSESNSDSSSNDGFHVISDEEISRSLSGTSPYTPQYEFNAYESHQMATTKTIFDIEGTDQSETEIWINAGGCYSVPIFMEEENVKLYWEFSTEPRSIAFAVTYKEVDVKPADVVIQPLLPSTRCKSHLHPITGSITVKRNGIYTLIFDNRFSMIMAKKLKYKLRIQR